MSITSKLARLALMSAPLLGVMAAPALANVRSVNSSTVCHWEVPEAREHARYSPMHGAYHTQFADDGTANNLLTCNIPRNLPLRTDGMSDLEIRFRAAVTSPTGSRTVACAVYSYRSDGTLAATAQKLMSVSLAGTETVPMDFGSLISSSGSKGYYIVSCDLPTHIALHSIYSSENDGVSSN